MLALILTALVSLHRVTAYCGCPICCGKWALFHVTASGWEPHQGTTVAADTHVWPMGSCLEIQGLGRRVVQDTGRAIKGARIDVFYYSHLDAKRFGTRLLVVGPCKGGAK